MSNILFKAADSAFRLAMPETSYVTVEVAGEKFKVARNAGAYAIIG